MIPQHRPSPSKTSAELLGVWSTTRKMSSRRIWGFKSPTNTSSPSSGTSPGLQSASSPQGKPGVLPAKAGPLDVSSKQDEDEDDDDELLDGREEKYFGLENVSVCARTMLVLEPLLALRMTLILMLTMRCYVVAGNSSAILVTPIPLFRSFTTAIPFASSPTLTPISRFQPFPLVLPRRNSSSSTVNMHRNSWMQRTVFRPMVERAQPIPRTTAFSRRHRQRTDGAWRCVRDR